MAERRRYKLRVRDVIFEGGTHVMGILNVTPDSLFEKSRANSASDAVRRAGIMLAEGAEIIDIGGQSTRPGAQTVSESEEADRVIPSIRAVREAYPQAPISVDTFYASVAERAAEAGADMINDVSCLFDDDMANIIAKYGIAVCVMHNRRGSHIEDMMADKRQGLRAAIDKLLATGVGQDRILLDGGIGFDLSREEDIELAARYGELVDSFEYPFLLGASRKSFLGGEPEDRLSGTIAATVRAYEQGVLFVRVHDVRQNAQAILRASTGGEYR